MAKKARNSKSIVLPLFINIILVALGGLLIWKADAVTRIFSISLGVMICLCAIYYFIDFLRAKVEDREFSKFVAAIALGCVGAFFIIQDGFINEFISALVGIIIAIRSINGIQDAIIMKKFGASNYRRPLILSLIGVLCGALCILGQLIVPTIVLRVLGVMMIVFGVTNAFSITTVYESDAKAQAESAKQSKRTEAIEAEVVKK